MNFLGESLNRSCFSGGPKTFERDGMDDFSSIFPGTKFQRLFLMERGGRWKIAFREAMRTVCTDSEY